MGGVIAGTLGVMNAMAMGKGLLSSFFGDDKSQRMPDYTTAKMPNIDDNERADAKARAQKVAAANRSGGGAMNLTSPLGLDDPFVTGSIKKGILRP